MRHAPGSRATARDAAPAESPRALVIGCGALARELVELVRVNGLGHVDITCLPAELHNRPERIPGAVARRLAETRGRYAARFVAYADCGTGGRLDRVLEAEGVERLPGAHCYEVYAGSASFSDLMDDEPGTFFLTDFLARNFERLVIRGLGLDRLPQLRDAYFGAYRRVVYLSQRDDPVLLDAARAAATRLGLDFVHRPTGTGGLGAPLSALGAGPSAAPRALLPAIAVADRPVELAS